MRKQALLEAIRPPAKTTRTLSTIPKEEEANYVGLGADGILALTEKLLATNRGVIPPDNRDSLGFKTIYTPDKLMAERVRMDAGKVRLALLRKLARTKTLKNVTPGYFSDYAKGLIVGNSMGMPLEEINPMHVVEQARRVTAMGPGGLGSEDAVTEDAQAVSASQFGFFSPSEGPESSLAGIDKRLANGVRYGSDGQLYQIFLNRRTGKREWVSHAKAADSIIKIPD